MIARPLLVLALGGEQPPRPPRLCLGLVEWEAHSVLTQRTTHPPHTHDSATYDLGGYYHAHAVPSHSRTPQPQTHDRGTGPPPTSSASIGAAPSTSFRHPAMFHLIITAHSNVTQQRSSLIDTWKRTSIYTGATWLSSLIVSFRIHYRVMLTTPFISRVCFDQLTTDPAAALRARGGDRQ